MGYWKTSRVELLPTRHEDHLTSVPSTHHLKYHKSCILQSDHCFYPFLIPSLSLYPAASASRPKVPLNMHWRSYPCWHCREMKMMIAYLYPLLLHFRTIFIRTKPDKQLLTLISFHWSHCYRQWILLVHHFASNTPHLFNWLVGSVRIFSLYQRVEEFPKCQTPSLLMQVQDYGDWIAPSSTIKVVFYNCSTCRNWDLTSSTDAGVTPISNPIFRTPWSV